VARAWWPSRTSDQLPPNPQLEALIPDFRPRFQSDNFLVHLRAARAGLGAMILGRVTHRFNRDTTLVPLSLDLGPYARSSMYLVCPRTALDIPRIRLVAELLGAELEKAAA
jgi:DNA-binding transcriptional LysR family regulator